MLVGAGVVGCLLDPGERDEDPGFALTELDNAEFRAQLVAFVRLVGLSGRDVPCMLPALEMVRVRPDPDEMGLEPSPQTVVSIYAGGKLVGRGMSGSGELCAGLTEATQLAVTASGLERARVAEGRFAVELTNSQYATVEHDGGGVELVHGLVPVRTLDKAMLRRRIDEGTAYLLRVMDPELGGVHKHYHASTDRFDDRLHTLYTASTLYTLLAVYSHDQDERLREPIDRAAGFLLSMQRVAPGQPGHGAFHYSMVSAGDPEAREREPRFVVGTTAKSIFALIDLHDLTGDAKVLDAARLAGDWLLTMHAPDGRVSSELRLDSSDTPRIVERESLLYTGQVLSALSRLHQATGDSRYLDAASRTAGHLLDKVEREGCYLGDDYRAANPISSSWVILSLFDFARASGSVGVRDLAFECADALIRRQIDDPDDAYRHGRWQASLSSSGSGWLAEVLSELYLDCPDDDPNACARFREPIVRLFRVLMQHTYSPENSFVAKRPAMALGGLFWNTLDRDVRTDSVCHAMNAYVSMIDHLHHLPDGVLIELPEPPLAERLTHRSAQIRSSK